MATESIQEAEARWSQLIALQEHYEHFVDFVADVFEDLLGYICTDIHIDMASYMQFGPDRCMVQAQRSQSKTTISACYAVWRLIHEPEMPVFIVSAGGDLAYEISNWIIQIINNMPELECMRPDKTHGDRASVKAFDIHYTLKGANKSPSVSCRGIFGQLNGKRGRLLLADDIELNNNADTELKREKIRQITKDFTSICQDGKIMYLGTPQSSESIYNSLPDRGYDVRIWPGRYPNADEVDHYNGCLAPLIVQRMKDDPSLMTGGGPMGDRGQPVDPDLPFGTEDKLTAKEIDQGKAYFQLQYMLDTRLMDADRYPLKASRIILTQAMPNQAPAVLNFTATADNLYPLPLGHPCRRSERMYMAMSSSSEFLNYQGCYMYVDPSGGGKNGDELAWAVTKFVNGYIYLVDVGGIPGGIHQENLDFLTEIAVKWKPQEIGVERNFGNGALAQVWLPQLLKKHTCGIEEPWESGQKELRIIDIMEPLLGAGRFVMDMDLLQKEWETCSRYPAADRVTYCFMHQLTKITRDKGALMHDDRLDAVAGSCRHWAEQLAVDADREVAKQRQEQFDKMRRNPMGRPTYGDPYACASISQHFFGG